MTATATDAANHYFFEAKPRWTGTIGSGGVADAVTTTIPLASATNLDSGDAYIYVINRVDANGGKNALSEMETGRGELSGTNLINCQRGDEGTASGWDAGTVVEILMTATHWNKMIEGIGVEHNADGTHSDITADSLTSDSLSAETTNGDLSLLGNGTGTVKKPTEVQMVIVDYTADVATGDGQYYLRVGKLIDSMNLTGVHAEVITAGTTGTTDIQVHNVTDTVDMLSTKLTIDSGETGSDTAATPAVIDTSNDDVSENDVLRIDVDAVSTTAPQGLIVTLLFELP